MTDKRIIDNQRYNAERKAQAELMKRDLDRDRVLAKIYQEGYDRMQAQIDQFYMSYAGQNGLTKQEAVKRVSDFDVTKFNEKAARAVKDRDFSPETNAWLKTYNLKMRVSRLELLKAELALEIQNLTAEANEVFEKARRDEQLAEFKRQAGILGNSATGAKKRLEAILEADFYGQTFSSRVWGGTGLQATLQRDVFGSLNRIYTDMMGYKQERDRLAKKFGTSRANAQRLLKTEIARINADTQLAMLKENQFTHMIFVAEPGACDLCGPLDQKAIPIDRVEKGVNMFPMHPNCRCSAYGHIKMDYKAGGSTLDEYEVWDGDIKPDKKQGQKQIEGRSRLKIEGGQIGTANELISDVESIWSSIANQELSRQQIASRLRASYHLGELPNELAKVLGKSSVAIDRNSLSHSLSKHGGQYGLEEFKLVKEMVLKPSLALDNSDRIPNSAILYKNIPGKDKVLLEGVIKPSEDMLLIHFAKVGVRQKKKNLSKYKTIYLSDE